jgi:hypothetical protein
VTVVVGATAQISRYWLICAARQRSNRSRQTGCWRADFHSATRTPDGGLQDAATSETGVPADAGTKVESSIENAARERANGQYYWVKVRNDRAGEEAELRVGAQAGFVS